jgi:type VI secretion system protein
VINRAHIVILLAGVFASGCGVPKHASHAVGIRRDVKFFMQLNVSPAANNNNPVAMDFVMVLDKKLIKEVGKLAAKDWFDRREQIQRDYPNLTEVVPWELVPGQHTGTISVDVNPKAQGAFLFAKYLNTGDNRAAIDLHVPVVVNLLEEGFTVQPLK